MKKIKQLDQVRIGRGEVKGYLFVQIRKSNKGYCYEVSINGRATHYEVFKHRINRRFDPACVSYPTKEAFGIWAWAPIRRETALQRLNDL